jgi:hypothetical protein
MLNVQMSVWVPVIAALAGGIVGGIAPVVVGLLQSRAEHRRELVRLAVQLAVEENKAAIEFVKLQPNLSISISPIALNLAYHAGLLEMLQKGEPILPADVEALKARTTKLFQ